MANHGGTEQDSAAAYDVVVVGSGAGGMVAALRLHDLGLSSIVIEKTHHYGGTSATSGGGTWIPMNDSTVDDSLEKALTYLRAVTAGSVPDEGLRVYAEKAIEMTRYIERYGVKSFGVPGYPDYYSRLPGAVISRAMLPYDMDGAILGEEFFRLRDPHPFLLAFNRYVLNFEMSAVISARLPGWRKMALKMLAQYWLDIPWRLKTRRDRRLTMGRALVGGLRKAMMDRNIPLLLNTELVDLEKEGERVTAAICLSQGSSLRIGARKALVLAAGGYEQNQEMRDTFMAVPTKVRATLAPRFANTGDAIRIGKKAGAAIEGMDHAWWCPVVRLPSLNEPNVDVSHGLLFERGRPGTITVNRLGKRFVNEAVSYDQFGLAMIEEEKRTGSANPCWMIFDAAYRGKHPAGGLMPAWVKPDKSLPQEWWDNILYRAASIPELARKIRVPEDALAASVEANNRHAAAGIDDEFHRGESPYDQFLGEPGVTPNNCLGPIATAPFYAIAVELGDLGTKGGLKVNTNAEVLDAVGEPIPGLYAIGNTTASAFGGFYPGAGSTLGPAMTSGYLAANHIASRMSNQRAGVRTPASAA